MLETFSGLYIVLFSYFHFTKFLSTPGSIRFKGSRDLGIQSRLITKLFREVKSLALCTFHQHKFWGCTFKLFWQNVLLTILQIKESYYSFSKGNSFTMDREYEKVGEEFCVSRVIRLLVLWTPLHPDRVSRVPNLLTSYWKHLNMVHHKVLSSFYGVHYFKSFA